MIPLKPMAVVMLVMVLAGAACVRAQTWTEFGPAPEETQVVGDSISEPFFAFLIKMAEEDSLGTWDGADVAGFARATGHVSRFPLDELVSIRRVRPSLAELRARQGVTVTARWDLELAGDLDRPMPYDILGYHPGSLKVSRRLELMEMNLGDKDLHSQRGKKSFSANFKDIRIFALTKGYMVLDADGLIDALLGSALDDSWTVGLVVAREGERRIGLGVSLGRKGRKIYGEFDFARDKVLAHGRPAVSLLSSYCRRWLDPERFMVPPPWQGLPGS